jgi:hypothetical protein
LGRGSSRGCLAHPQQQQLPLEVTRQLQWQASEVVRLTGQLQQLQVSHSHQHVAWRCMLGGGATECAHCVCSC